jgi:coenzyme F420-reducing hydrogenase gamma subunit
VARHVVAVGSCAAWGGITATGANPTEACGLQYEDDQPGGLLGAGWRSRSGLPVINVAGCPTHPGWVIDTLMALVRRQPARRGGPGQLGRPRFYADQLVHHGCTRNEYYEFKASAEKPSDLGCMMEHMGCKGTQAHADCNTRLWNGEGSCTRGGYACISCTEPGFQDPGHAFHQHAQAGRHPHRPAHRHAQGLVRGAGLAEQERHAAAREAERHRRPPGGAAGREVDKIEVSSTRLIVGPFNRVEGDLEVRLDLADGRVRSAQVVSPMYRGFEPMLVGRDPLDALVIVPRICGICSVSQSLAAARALASAAGVQPPPNGTLALNLLPPPRTRPTT